jgi:hypothetical protein
MIISMFLANHLYLEHILKIINEMQHDQKKISSAI